MAEVELPLAEAPNRAALQDCPLVEIVHFHDCLRGEVQLFAEGVAKLRAMLESGCVVGEAMAQLENPLHTQFKSLRRVFQAHSKAEDELIWPELRKKAGAGGPPPELLETALGEDHADEEGIFSQIEDLLCRLGEGDAAEEVRDVLVELEGLAKHARENLLKHLEREETEVLPLIHKLFTREEMARMVGVILGERPGDLMHLILAMMFRNLSPESRADMLRHVKDAVDGTFFDRWLSYARLANEGAAAVIEARPAGKEASPDRQQAVRATDGAACYMACYSTEPNSRSSPALTDKSPPPSDDENCCRMCHWVGRCPRESPLQPGEFEAAVKAIARDTSIGMGDKSKAVQLLRSCAWTEGNKRRRTGDRDGDSLARSGGGSGSSAASGGKGKPQRTLSLHGLDRTGRPTAVDVSISPQDLAPSFTANGELGCAHYRRACKLRAECCGRLVTCRLCHDETTPDHVMDRYAVKDVLCMRCGALQPVGQYCRSQACQGLGLPLAKYYCDICRFFDDETNKDIYHCPYCNVCRLGKGLGVDYRHCMTCNACISLKVPSDKHKCIEQALQRDCPVCSEPLFSSTSHYKVLPRCGHTLHRHCFQAYRETGYTCPICQKSMEDMTSHFANLDLLMQANPMPDEFTSWRSHILCQDCGVKSDVPYHFCYHKCPACASYNTRVLWRGSGHPPASASDPSSAASSPTGGSSGSSR